MLALSSAEIGAVCGITAISMLLDVSSLEVARQKSADLDKEFRTNGLPTSSRPARRRRRQSVAQRRPLDREVGRGGPARRRLCGACLRRGPVRRRRYRRMVPKAILSGMLAYLGVTILAERWFRAGAARGPTWRLAIAIMIVIAISAISWAWCSALSALASCSR